MRSTHRYSCIRSLKRQGFQEKIVIKIGLYDLVMSTTLESNKSLVSNHGILLPRVRLTPGYSAENSRFHQI
jgi:hypothetical protein